MDDGFFNSSSATSRIDIYSFFDSNIGVSLARVLSLGVLVSFGTTRDGGALGIAVMHDGRKRREYFRGSDDAVEFLDSAAAALSGAGVGRQNGNRAVAQNPTRGPSEPF